MTTHYVKDFNEILSLLTKDTIQCFYPNDNSIFKELELKTIIKDRKKHLILPVINLKKEERGKGLLSNFLSSLPHPITIDNIINEDLECYLEDKGWIYVSTQPFISMQSKVPHHGP